MQRWGTVAILIIVAGSLTFAARALIRNRAPTVQPADLPVTDAVSQTLTPTLLEKSPTAYSILDDVSDLAAAARAHAARLHERGSLNAAQQADLEAAVHERALSLLFPNAERDFESAIARGCTQPWQEFKRKFDEQKEWRQMSRLAQFGVNSLRVVLLWRGGVEVGSDRNIEGFGRIVTTDPSISILPADPGRAGLDVVEVSFPLKKKPRHGAGRGVVLAGFRFAWVPSLSKWVPFASVLYTDPNESHFALPL